MPCPNCGASVPRSRQHEHVCNEGQRASYELFQIRTEADRFDGELRRWLETPRGRFALYYVERERRRAA
jgi:hypothetical protein